MKKQWLKSKYGWTFLAALVVLCTIGILLVQNASRQKDIEKDMLQTKEPAVTEEESVSVLSTSEPTQTETGTESIQTEVSSPEELLAEMSLEEKIGQMLLVNFRSWKTADMSEADDLTVMNDEIAQIISDYHIGNVILFGENTKNTEQTVKLTYDLQRAAVASGGVPLMIGIDQEGGVVTRLGQGTCMPGNMAIGATGNPDYAYDNGSVIGEELKALGMDATFAPDADVNDNPDNPIVNLRSFGEAPKQVAELVQKMQEGLNAQGTAACAKHFPGHGNTATDTHTGLAIVEKTRAEWEACEKVPFQAAVNAKIDMIMTAHIQYPQLDDTQVTSVLDGSQIYLPATLSERIVTGILRDEMGYDGVVSTDAMDMQAIKDHFGETDAIIMAMNAGVDLMCNPTKLSCVEDASKLQEIYTAVGEAIQSGELSEAKLDAAVLRILRLKEKREILAKSTEEIYTAEQEQYATLLQKQTEQAEQLVGSREHRETERTIAEAAITVVHKELFKAFTPAAEETVLFILPFENESYSVQYAVNRLSKEQRIQDFHLAFYVYEKESKMSDILRQEITDADYILLASEMYGSTKNDVMHWQNVIPREVCEYVKAVGKQEDMCVLSLGMPYDAVNYPEEPVLAAYGYKAMTKEDAESGVITEKYGPNIPAVVGAALGAFEPKGVLPVEVE